MVLPFDFQYSSLAGPRNKRWSEKSSKTTVDSDGHHSKEKASVIRLHLQNVRWL